MNKREAKLRTAPLRVVALPFAYGFDRADEYDYAQFLDLHVEERAAFIDKMNPRKTWPLFYAVQF